LEAPAPLKNARPSQFHWLSYGLLTVIAFLVVTSIINLALGYALAVYLRTGGARLIGMEPDDSTATSANVPTPLASFEPNRPPWIPTATSAMAGATCQQSETSPELAPIARLAEVQEAEEPQTATSGMEQELLAGIEEFRNQLAQLKGHNFDDAMPSPFAPEAAGAR
jgi:hypothetical protein